MKAEALIANAALRGSSDIHLCYGSVPKQRVDGELRDMDAPELDDAELLSLAGQVSGLDKAQLETLQEWDGACTLGGQRIRINLFRQQGHLSAALRLLSDRIPELSALGLPPAADMLGELPRGLVLITGETGSGKSTTLAAVINDINRTRRDHIITIEDPIEYVYTPASCLISQRELGRDTGSFSAALRAALREDPDVVLVGELRDNETIETALTAAETGHLVFGTLHTGSAADTIDRIVDVFPEGKQRQIRLQLSMTLRCVLAQQLLPRIGGGRVCACEAMVLTPAIRNLIREGKTPQIQNAMATGTQTGSVTMDNALLQLWQSKLITAQTARLAAQDREYVTKRTM